MEISFKNEGKIKIFPDERKTKTICYKKSFFKSNGKESYTDKRKMTLEGHLWRNCTTQL